MQKEIKLLPVILAGGSGTRLWPLSRESFPKQFISLSENTKLSQFQSTIKRIQNLGKILDPLIICNEDHRFIVAEQCRLMNVKPSSIILEPLGRNTAPAIIIAALNSLDNNEDPILIVLAADHEIKNEKTFLKSIKLGEKYALDKKLVTFGIIPDRPETGFGYIKSSSQNNLENQPSKIERFIEKPKIELAKKLLRDGRYTWNSGMFIFRASTIIKEIKKFEPELLDICKKSISKSSRDLDFLRIDKNLFSKCKNISIDNAVMERTELGIVIPLDAEWSDLGTWKAIWEQSNKDRDGNTTKGDIVIEDSKKCYIRGDKRLVVGIGLEELVVIDTSDAILISHKEKLDKVKNIVKKLKKDNNDKAKIHKKVHRPWGEYTSIEEGEGWKVKIIEVKTGSSLSLQMHNHRAEHWVVVSGTAEVEIDDKRFLLYENQSTFIPLGSKHRLSNAGEVPLILIEVQSGDYLGEDDIIRFQDFYGRVKN